MDSSCRATAIPMDFVLQSIRMVVAVVVMAEAQTVVRILRSHLQQVQQGAKGL